MLKSDTQDQLENSLMVDLVTKQYEHMLQM